MTSRDYTRKSEDRDLSMLAHKIDYLEKSNGTRQTPCFYEHYLVVE